ncbi:MAG: capsule assembly Wzi family protein [Tannerella sp.]|nr:capsule assembly Wzi family protein [Tannerella sp.]
MFYSTKKYLLLLGLISVFSPGLSQNDRHPSLGTTDFNIEAFGSAATGEHTPFWIVSNRHGTVPLSAGGGYLRAGTFHKQSLGESLRWGAGLDVIASTPRYRSVYIRQLYAEIGYKWLSLAIGSKDSHTSLWDENLSSGDLVHSANARPIPEINIYMPRFTAVPGARGILQFRGNFAIGRSFDTEYLKQYKNDRQYYIENVLWHHKSLHVRIVDPYGHFPLTATIGIRHHAQWGGTSTNPEEGVQPHSLKDLMRIIVGGSGGNDATISAQVNVLGNHYGSYDIKLGYLNPLFDVHLYKQHFFDDVSGMELFNLPDGLYGIQANIPNFPFINKAVIEYVYTKNQSGPVHYIQFDHSAYPGYGGGRDEYYNSEEYTTGISYFNRSIGSPLITSPEYNKDGHAGFKNNRIRAWHAGIGGYLSRQVAYRLLMTNSEGWGTMVMPFLKKTADFSCAVKISYCHPRLAGWLFSGEVGSDRGSIYGDNLGIALSASKTGTLKIWR